MADTGDILLNKTYKLAELYGKIKLTDLNDHYVVFRRLNKSSNVYLNEYTNPFEGYTSTFLFKDNQVFSFKLQEGKFVQDKYPLVKLDTQKVPVLDDKGEIKVDEKGDPVTQDEQVVTFMAFRDVTSPFDLHPFARTEKIYGDTKDEHTLAVALLQATVKFLQSLNYFSFEPNKATELSILDQLVSDPSAQVTTTTTTVAPGTTTTTTEKPAETTTTTTVKPAVPGKPILEITGVGDTSFDYKITPPADAGTGAITYYTIKYTETGNPSYAHQQSIELTGTVKGPRNGHELTIDVTAHNSVGDSEASDSVKATPVAPTTTTTTAKPEETTTTTTTTTEKPAETTTTTKNQ